MLPAKSLGFLFVLFLLCLPAAAQNPSETHLKIRAAIENRDYQTAVIELQNLARADRKSFELNNYDYLLARAAEKRGDFATAMANYQTVIKRNSILGEYALRHLAQIARATGNLPLERVYLRQLLTLAPDGLLKDAAQARLARSYFESRDFQTAIQMFSGQSLAGGQENTANNANKSQPVQNNAQPPNDAKTRENLVFLGKSYLQLGNINEAREVFTRLISNLPNLSQPDDFALAAAKGLDEIDGGRENPGKIAPQISDSEHYRRALIYQFNRDFAAARLHFAAIVEQFPQSNYAPDAMYQTGRGFVQEGNFEEAIRWFERVQTEFPENPAARDALSQTASAFSRINKPKEAIVRYQKFIEKYTDADNPERAYLNIVDIERDSGRDADALKWTQKTREAFRGKLPEALAAFAEARIYMAQNDWASALNDLNEMQNFPDLGGTRAPGGTNQAEITFLKGYALEQLQRFPEAIDVYLSIPDGRSEYYGWRATERLKTLAADEKSKAAAETKLSSLLRQLSDAGATNMGDFALVSVMQSVLRLTNYAELRAAMLQKLKTSYALFSNNPLSNYKIPNFKLLEFGRAEVLKEPRALSTDYHRAIADELLFLGLYDEATPELETALAENGKLKTENAGNVETNPKSKIQNPKSNDLAYTLAVFYARGDMANRAVQFAEPLWRQIPADYQIELIPREQIELLYPAPYADALRRFAPEKNVDARFILSIMRQESRYRADVKSNAAARGLMQFISSTSNRVALELGRSDFNQDELYNPPAAIEFGSAYLSDLFRQFPAQPPAVAAAYNGGETNVTRWLARAKSDNPDRYVPEIIFSQSKDYVYKVMANYRVYQMFYDENLKTR